MGETTMFRTAELGRKVSSAEYKERVPQLRMDLLEVQQEILKVGSFPVIIVFAGVDGAGKEATINVLNEWMDPRWLVTRAYGTPSEEERERPEYWRYWRDLPPRGQIGFFLSSWYSRPVLERAYGEISLAELDERLDRIIAFESELADDGAVIMTFWMHLSREMQKTRLRKLEKDPLNRWRIKNTAWKHWRMYDQFMEATERTIMRTNTGKAPLHIVEGADHRYRSLTVGNIIRDTLRKRLAQHAVEARVRAEAAEQIAAHVPEAGTGIEPAADEPLEAHRLTVLDSLDMGLHLDKKTYGQKLRKYQAKLNLLHHQAVQKGVSTMLVFEGWDAAGKGGAIRRVTAALEARHARVLPFAAPTDEERAHHYLWRFWRHLSRAGGVTIFDRSWYGRVLVERVEGFAREEEWRRAYAEINDFEDQLVAHGIVLLKYWIHITKDEQLARFQARERTGYKRWKLTDEDWRNREKWEHYELAVNDMVQYTSTRTAPWILVEGNDKRHARIRVLESLCQQLETALGVDDE